MSLVVSLLEGFSLTWDMLRDAIDQIPDEHWKTGEIEHLAPARQIFHIIETADFYARKSRGDFPRDGRFGTDWDKAHLDDFPDKETMREYLEEVVEKVEGWLKGNGEEGVLIAENEFPWTGGTVLSRVLYTLAHCRQHLGEINAELRHRGLPRVKWKTFD